METKMENTPVVEQKVDVEVIRSEVRSAEQARIRGIYELGNRFNLSTEANDYVQSNKSVEEFRAYVLDNVQARQAQVQPVTHLDLSAKEQKKYSLTRALSAIASKDYRKAGLELEASDEIAKRLGRPARGIFVPMDALATRGLSAGGTNTGKEFVGTDHLGGMAVSPLYANLVVRQLGATVLSGLVGNVDIPKGGSATAYWLSTETTDITGSTPATGSITLSPKTVGGLVSMTHRLLQQSDPSIDAMVRNDLINVLTRAIDAAAINGSASNGQPRGILNTVGIGAGSSLGATGGAPTWALVNELISLVESENAVGYSFLTNPKVVATLKTTAKVSSTDSVMIMNDNTLVGYPVAVSTLVPSNLTKSTGEDLSALIFGDFSNVIIGEWGVVELAASDSDGTNFQSGQVAIRAMADCDIGVKHPVAFAASKEIVTL